MEKSSLAKTDQRTGRNWWKRLRLKYVSDLLFIHFFCLLLIIIGMKSCFLKLFSRTPISKREEKPSPKHRFCKNGWLTCQLLQHLIYNNKELFDHFLTMITCFKLLETPSLNYIFCSFQVYNQIFSFIRRQNLRKKLSRNLFPSLSMFCQTQPEIIWRIFKILNNRMIQKKKKSVSDERYSWLLVLWNFSWLSFSADFLLYNTQRNNDNFSPASY